MSKKAKSEALADEPVQKPKRRRRRWRLPLLLIVAGALTWTAPLLVARTPLKQRAVNLLCADLRGECRAASLSLDWFSPVVIGGFTWHGPDGQLVLQAESIISERSLLDIVANRSQLGTFRVTNAKLSLEVRADGSNLEDALAPTFFEPPAAPRAFKIVATRGHVTVVDNTTGETGAAQDVELTFDNRADAAQSRAIQLKTNVKTEDQTGSVQVVADLGGDTEVMSIPLRDFKCRAEHCPLAWLNLVVHRFDAGLELGGHVTCDVQLQAADGQPVGIGGEVAVVGLSAQNPAWFGSDRLDVGDVRAAGQAKFEGQLVHLEQVGVESNLGQLQVSGTADLAAWQDENQWSPVLAVVRDQEFRVDGRLDLAKLAATLPDTLRVREGTTLTSGLLELQLISSHSEGRQTWSGGVNASDLMAMQGRQPISWERPIQMSFSAHRADETLVIDELVCRSGFLQASARGTLDDATFTAEGDLDRLAQDLGRFFDLGETQLAGRLRAELNCKRTDAQAFAADGALLVENFRWNLPGRQPWHEQRLDVQFAATGSAREQNFDRVDSGQVTVVSGADKLRAQLLAPWNFSDPASELLFQLDLQGNATTWTARLQPWNPLEGWLFGGELKLAAKTAVSQQQLRWETATLSCERFTAQGAGLRIDEPRLRIETSGTWDRIARQFTSPQVIVASQSFALRAVDLDTRLGAEGLPQLSGGMAIRVSLERVGNWVDRGDLPSPRRMTGTIITQLKFAHGDGRSTAVAQVKGTDLGIWRQATGNAARTIPGDPRGGGWQQTWSEPALVLHASAAFDRGRDRLELERLNVDSRLLKFASRGSVEEMSGRRMMDLAGDVEYDLANVTGLLQEYLGAGFSVAGHDARQFALRGPLRNVDAYSSGGGSAGSFAAWEGHAGFGWTSANFGELPVGPGALELVLSGGNGRFAPLDLAVGDGRLRLTPALDLGASDWPIVVQPGAALENVQLSEKVCEGWLKYLAPVMAQTTRADGRFSAQLREGRFPLWNMSAGHADGTLVIHTAQVRPGALAQQFVRLADQVQKIVKASSLQFTGSEESRWLTINNQNVDFQMRDGRVYHRGLEFTVGDVVIRTSGSVGFDQTLALTAEVPLQDKWLADNGYLQSLRGQALQIPVGGTLSQPQLDSRALAEIAGRMGTSAIRGKIEDELQKQLGKIFDLK